jgi:hypothetical protein
VPSTNSSRSSKLKLEAKAILACVPSTVLAGKPGHFSMEIPGQFSTEIKMPLFRAF